MHITTPPLEDTYVLRAVLVKDTTEIELETVALSLIPPPKLLITVAAGWRPNPTIGDVTILVYDANQGVVHEFRGATLSDGVLSIEGLKNIVPGQQYRIAILVAGYLPRQEYAVLDPVETQVNMRRLLPVDFNLPHLAPGLTMHGSASSARN